MKHRQKLRVSLQNKFLLLFILILFIPLASIASCGMAVGVMKRNIERTSLTSLQSLDGMVYEKTKNIQHIVDMMNTNSEIQAALAAEEQNSTAFAEAMQHNVGSVAGLKGLVCIDGLGQMLTYNLETANIDYIKMQVLYNVQTDKYNTLTWFAGTEKNAEIGFSDDVMVVGAVCHYSVDYSVNKQAAKVYICIDKGLFDDVLKDRTDNGALFILDKNGILLNGDPKNTWLDNVESSIKTMGTIYSASSGIVKPDDSELILAHYTSDYNDFKLVKIYEADLFYRDAYYILYAVIFFTVLVFVVVGAVYFVIVRRMTRQLKTLAATMNNFDDATLSRELTAEGNDEISSAMRGFNKMRSRIYAMLEEAKQKEREKKNMEFDVLRYQINPHFLYNTLGAIRVIAMKQHNDDIATALLLLNKTLKSVFSNVNQYVTFKEEIEQLQDYVYLLQLRYNNDINFSANIPEDMANMLLPAMLLQPIVENSVFHGLGEKLSEPHFDARILISAEVIGDDLLIEVFDNGSGMTRQKVAAVLSGEQKESRGIGLHNVDERIKLLYGAEYGVSIRSEPEVYTSVSIKLKKA